VNLERPVTMATRLGGHLVQGHIDAVGEVMSMERDGESATMIIEAPDGVARYLVEKGSVAVDGVSITVASVNGTRFGIALIPHTLEVTTLGSMKPGDRVNLEADVIAKYVARLVRHP
jgi:riboflavin synthase